MRRKQQLPKQKKETRSNREQGRWEKMTTRPQFGGRGRVSGMRPLLAKEKQ